MPHDFERPLHVAKLHGGHVREVVVALRGVVVQPLYDVVQPRVVDDHRRLAPHDVDALHGGGELLAQRGGRRVGRAAAVRYRARRAGAGGVGRQRTPRDDGGETVAHRPERVWWMELPNGSEISSMADGGMYNWLFGSGSISRLSDVSAERS